MDPDHQYFARQMVLNPRYAVSCQKRASGLGISAIPVFFFKLFLRTPLPWEGSLETFQIDALALEACLPTDELSGSGHGGRALSPRN